MAKIIDKAELSESLVNGYAQLNALSQGDYGRGVAEVFDDLEASPNDKLLRLGRLMGVALKQPYSEPFQMDPSLSRTGAMRGWNLLDDNIDAPQAMPTWQFQAMEGLSQEFGFGSQTTFAQIAKYETGFLKYMGNSFRKYLCGDPEMAKNIEKAVENLENVGGIKHLLTPQGLIGTGAVIIGGAAYRRRSVADGG